VSRRNEETAVKCSLYFFAAGYTPVTRHTMKQSIFSKPLISVNAIFLIAIQAINTPATAVIVLFSSILSSTSASAQNVRTFPDTAPRGKIVFKSPPQIELDGKADMLSPGARIRDERGMLAMTGALQGKAFVVNFKREASTGMVHEVWILTAEEQKVKRDGEKK
jgi:hypothetical protein